MSAAPSPPIRGAGWGIDGRMMEPSVERVDAAGEAAYLETEKPQNLRFYERLGLEVVGEGRILGTSS